MLFVSTNLSFSRRQQVLAKRVPVSIPLSMPYALSTSLANFNAGAVLGSYLVFDEFHLFPINRDGSGAFATTLHMLQLLRNLTPWTLMTATFSRTLLSGLCKLLNAVEISP